ncbi:MAG: putative membrane protein [Lysobacterales bacterium]|jgi:uncharacterized membrane protein
MWIILGLVAAFFTSFQEILNKKASKKINRYVLTWGWWAFAVPFFWIYMKSQEPVIVDPGFFLLVSVAAIFGSVAMIYYVKAIEAGDLSLSVPILSLSPILLLVTSPLITKEVPTTQGIFGVCVIVFGAYCLFFDRKSTDFLAPVRSLISNKGSKYMLVVICMFSISGNLDKVGVLKSNTATYLFHLTIQMTVILTIVMFVKCKNISQELRKGIPSLILIGLVNAIAYIAQLLAISMTQVPYLIAVKRSSVLFTSLYGIFILREGNLKQRLFGVVVMLAGVLIVSLT